MTEENGFDIIFKNKIVNISFIHEKYDLRKFKEDPEEAGENPARLRHCEGRFQQSGKSQILRSIEVHSQKMPVLITKQSAAMPSRMAAFSMEKSHKKYTL